MTHTVETIDTPDGPFTAVAGPDGAVIASGWTASPDEALARVREQWRPQDVRAGTVAAMDAVRSYYAGELDPVMAVPVELHGTDGQLAGWEQLRRIRPGDPQTYTEFAEVLGTPRAVRAAASVCARNPVALFVPCHRVLRSDGSMGGFAWGEDVKRSLLEREAAGRAR
ncbi:methylated-DNA--[protein]-cysteine S-methyltransferase [Kocuria rhizophila]|uniref:methylated-DNA--[protein]-cysteine S-methyltransferase n=1 Tax=Kocuria rhizophila TaxID=72000 RepID=UPI000EF18D31|nr:methylated-DNA--[protein]-cysteine S-methyltransferase [Kocuria rhizophila]RLP61160.1 methylated-DNA--[protein]-cysteine S-methyltransferase [Kocuria rhizophila]